MILAGISLIEGSFNSNILLTNVTRAERIALANLIDGETVYQVDSVGNEVSGVYVYVAATAEWKLVGGASTKADAVNAQNVPVVYADVTNKLSADLLPATTVYKDSITGKIDSALLPSLAITDTTIVDSTVTPTWKTTLANQDVGDVVVVSNLNETWIRQVVSTPAVNSDWVQLSTPTGGVTTLTFAGSVSPQPDGPVTGVARNSADNQFTAGQTITTDGIGLTVNTSGTTAISTNKPISATQLVSTETTLAPLTVASTAKVVNLNADLIADTKITNSSTALNRVLVGTSTSGQATWAAVSGDISTTTVAGGFSVDKIKGIVLDTTIPSNGQVLTFDNALSKAKWSTIPTGISAAVENNFTAKQTVTVTSGDSLVAAGGNITTNKQLVSTVATGTAPLSVTSTTVVTNLNTEMLSGNKLSNVVANGQLAIGSSTAGTATWVTPSGDISLTNAGVVAVNKVKGVTISGTPSIGSSLIATNTDAASWSTSVPVGALTSGAITADHMGLTLRLTGAVTIANNILPAGFSCILYNSTTADLNVTCAATSTFISGSDTTKTNVAVKIAKKGLCSVVAISPTEVLFSGDVS